LYVCLLPVLKQRADTILATTTPLIYISFRAIPESLPKGFGSVSGKNLVQWSIPGILSKRPLPALPALLAQIIPIRKETMKNLEILVTKILTSRHDGKRPILQEPYNYI
jgi:hypothetical protein